ncbi:MAG: hypothetical protein JWO82_1471 [Akkermansiaceae bacterium]|nr:hypothetical protein [Akkermansiaceae bacterium]
MLLPHILAFFLVDDLFYVYLAVAAASAAYSYNQSQKSADAQEEAGLMQKKTADQNAMMQEQQTAETVRRERVNSKRRLARIRTGSNAGSGLVNEGSIEDAFIETAGREELRIQDAARAGAMDAQGTRQQGEMSLWEARTQAVGTRVAANGTLLSNLGSMASGGVSYYGRQPKQQPPQSPQPVA